METKFKDIWVLTRRNLMILGIVLIIGLFAISSMLTVEITIKDMDKEVQVAALFSDVEGVLKKANVHLGEHDTVSMPLDTKAVEGMTLVIERAHPVTIHVDGEDIEAMTVNKKTKDILAEYNIAMTDDDRTEPGLEEEVQKYETINVVRVNQEVITENMAIPYESIIRPNDKLDMAKMNVIQKGKNGEKQVKYTITYEDGKAVSKELVEEKVLTKAEDEIVEKGTAQYLATSRGAVRYKKEIKMSATAYDATFESTGKNPGDKYYGITRSGTKVRPGVVAVDPKVIPLGTKLYVKALDGSGDYGFAIAEDTGGAIKGNKIDLYFESPKDVKKYGRRKVVVYVLD